MQPVRHVVVYRKIVRVSTAHKCWRSDTRILTKLGVCMNELLLLLGAAVDVSSEKPAVRRKRSADAFAEPLGTLLPLTCSTTPTRNFATAIANLLDGVVATCVAGATGGAECHG
jgi:hypothetical protein